MSSDGRLPPNERHNYKHAFNAIGRIYAEEGYKTLWTGVRPAMIRCMVLNVTQIVLYKNTKVLLLQTGKVFLKIIFCGENRPVVKRVKAW